MSAGSGATRPSGETLAIYKELEDYWRGRRVARRRRGDPRGAAAGALEDPDAWQAAAAEVGIAPIAEFNRGDNAGTAYFHVNQRRGRRWSMADAFPPDRAPAQPHRVHPNPCAEDPDGRRGATRSAAWRLDHGALSRHRGSAAQRGPGGRRPRPPEVILSAGAIGSPHLMQLSGLGPAAPLSSHQVPVTVDLPGVGENPRITSSCERSTASGAPPTVNTLYRNWITRAGMGLQYLLRRSGPMTMPPSTLGAFAKSDPDLASADLEWHVQPLSCRSSANPCTASARSHPSVCNLRPSSRGHVRMAGPDPLAARGFRATTCRRSPISAPPCAACG